MRKGLSRFILFLLLLILFSHSNAFAENELTEEQALGIMVAQIQKDKLYDSWTTISCLSFYTEKKTKDYLDFVIHEKHGEKCPGDPNTSPIVDRFRVNRFTKKIQWYEPTEGEWHPYRDALKARLRR